MSTAAVEVDTEQEAAATTAVQETRTPSYVSTNDTRKKRRGGGSPPSIIAVHGAQSTAAVEVDTEQEAAPTTAVQETRTPSYVPTNGIRKKRRVGGTPPSIVAVHGAQSTATVVVDTERQTAGKLSRLTTK